MRSLVALSALLTLTACGGFSPMSGSWSVEQNDVISDSCGRYDEEDEDIGDTSSDPDLFTLTVQEDGSFLLIPDENTDTTCTLDGHSFTCADIVSSESMEDTTFSVTVGLAGVFSDEEHLTGTVSQLVHCEGSYCEMADMAEDCTVELSFTGTFVE
ncbi:MAG: hypothetical protein JXX28_18790 [Deltaproteobacteria bacterium]|nr:hypothetical protein [Deltaproteobacteria bacterium]